MSFEETDENKMEQKISQDFYADEHLESHRQTFGRGGGGPASPRQRLVILGLGLLNAALILTAVVIGIYCAKGDYLQVPNSAATPLIFEMNYLRNHSDLIRAKLEAQAELTRERAKHEQLKLQVKHTLTSIDILQSEIQTLSTERTKLQADKTTLEESCGRCPQGWSFLKSSCYYFSDPSTDSKKNWPDSRAKCLSQGADLLVINNMEEQQLISNNFPKPKGSGWWWQNGFWIGLTDVVTAGTWVWVNNVTEVETGYWKSGQPAHDGPQSGNCAAFYYFANSRGTWYNGNCTDHQFNWICEMMPSST